MFARQADPSRLAAAVVIGALTVSAAACGGTGATQRGEQQTLRTELLVAQGVAREHPANAPIEQTVAGMTAFGYALYQASADPSTNTVLSPLSLASAFAMARAGATGSTAQQLDQVFGFPAEGPHSAFNILTGDLDGGDDVAIANGLWIQDDFSVKKQFLETLAAQYGAGVRGVDFGSPAAAGAINEWVREQTRDRIKKLFDRLDPDTRVVLANAANFKADWKHRFDKKDTGPAPFTRADGRVVQVPMMRRLDNFRYAAGTGWQAVELPYANSDLVMWVLVPTGAADPGGLLAPDVLTAVGAGLEERAVDLYLPGWHFGTAIDLIEQLAELGLTDLTGWGGISDVPLWVGDAVHRANITVDEQGTEAAAVTGIAIQQVCGSCGLPPTVRADRPFAFAIVHAPTKAPLFIGHVADPTDVNDGANAAAG